MMLTRWLIVGQDPRMKWLAKFLTHEQRTIYYKCTNQWDINLNELVVDFQPHHIVLPIQPLKLAVQEVHGLCHTTIYAGNLTPEWHNQLQSQTVKAYLQDDDFIWQNAALTAEAMLVHLLQQGMRIRGSKIVIFGFGRVAKMVAHLFEKVGAHIQIVTFSTEQLAEAAAYGYRTEILDEYFQTDAMCFINTIPIAWLTTHYKELVAHKLYDIASVPGCLKEITLQNYELIPSLPGKYYPQAAAELLGETILRQSRRN